MTPAEFKQWRERMGLTQQAFADRLGLSKGTVDLYERGSRREDGRAVVIPKPVADASERIIRLWKQEQRQHGPVSLIYADGPMIQPIDGRPGKVPMMCVEPFATNEEAIGRACELIGLPSFHNPFISDPDGVLWNGAELRAECQKRAQARSSTQIVACPECGLRAEVFTRIVSLSRNTTVNISSTEMIRLCQHIDEMQEQFRCPVMQQAIDYVRDGKLPEAQTLAFRVIETELDASKVIGRRQLGRAFATKTEAELEARRLAERFEHHNGFDPEHGYWWGRDPAPSRTYRYVVEDETCPACYGTGSEPVMQRQRRGAKITSLPQCPKCGGTGKRAI